ncbi:MAG: bifunctional phosphopantothenoylcysteine decarboxylase/phosphopantothenate--cysteine ligase CoaBC [Pseudomonadota bacterium]
MATDRKSVLLIIGGGIAAYKSLDLIRRLAERGVRSRAILTRAGAEFVTPLSVSALTGDKVYSDLFDLTDEAEMGHIELSRSADLLVVAPATADLMAKAATGLANDLASTALLATDKPVLFAPAMNVRMWDHPATRRNVETLRGDGALFVGPTEGDMACGEYGPGRMAEPLEIVAAVMNRFEGSAARADGPKPLAGKHAVITAGPTHEPIDPVRYIANRSSGKQGYAIAAALAKLGAKVTLVSGPTALPDPAEVETVRVETAADMLAASTHALPADIAVCSAAVSDYRPTEAAADKLKKVKGGINAIPLTENPDILHILSAPGPRRPSLVVGFAAETANIIEYAKGKLARKGCDLIVANDVSEGTGVMGGERNAVHLVFKDKIENWPNMPKTEVADRLAARIAAYFDPAPKTKAAE